MRRSLRYPQENLGRRPWDDTPFEWLQSDMAHPLNRRPLDSWICIRFCVRQVATAS